MNESFNFEAEKINTVDMLRELRYSYHDDIPQEEIHSDSIDNRYKVRKAWFDHVIDDVYMLKEENKITDENLIKEADDFSNKYSSDDFKNRLTTKEDIQDANTFIDTVLENIRPGYTNL